MLIKFYLIVFCCLIAISILILFNLIRSSKNLFLFLINLEFFFLNIMHIIIVFGLVWGIYDGQVFSFFIIALAASEAVVGFGFLIKFYNNNNYSLSTAQLQKLRG
jgi:NADH-quinone oxidoreductase subunit K